MKARALCPVALLLLALGCAHTRSAAHPQQEERAAERAEESGDGASAGADDSAPGEAAREGEPSGDAAREPEAAAGEPARSARKSRSKDAVSGDAREAGDGDDASEEQGDAAEDIEVATSPQGLLKPGAEDTVREKLGLAKGAGMRSALRRFQREHDLPATGMLDHETVEKLGLSPGDIFDD